MRIRTKLIVSFIIATFLSIAAVSCLGYYFAQRQLTDSINAELAAVVSAEAQRMDGWLKSKSAMVTTSGNIIHTVIGNSEVPKNYLAVYKNDPDISDMYVGYPNGKFVDGSGWSPPADFNAAARPWFKKAVEVGVLTYSDPYIDAITKEYVVTAALPFKDGNGNISSVAGADVLLTTLTKQAKSINIKGIGYAVLIDNNGVVLSHPDGKLIGKKLTEQDSTKAYADIVKSGDKASHIVKGTEVDQIFIYERIPSTGWKLALVVPLSYINDQLYKLALSFTVFGLLAIIAVAAYGWFFSRKIVAPITAITEGAQRMAEGNLAIRVSDRGTDELSALGGAFNKMGENLRKLVSEVVNSSQQVAASSEQLTASSEQTAHTIGQVVDAITEVARGTDQQFKAVDKTEAEVRQISLDLEGVAGQADEVAGLASKSACATANGQKAVNQSIEQMNSISAATSQVHSAVAKLASSSKQIGEIVNVISNIAGQTNLLALNAAIEAARAGEQGRGFAVVAEEVRKLAEQSQEAAKQISELIGDNRLDIDNAVSAMQAGTNDVKAGIDVVNIAGTAFSEITTLISSLSSQVDTIASSVTIIVGKSHGIVASVKEVGEISRQSSAQTQNVSAASQEQSASMQEIASASRSLAQMAEELQSTVSRFKL